MDNFQLLMKTCSCAIKTSREKIFSNALFLLLSCHHITGPLDHVVYSILAHWDATLPKIILTIIFNDIAVNGQLSYNEQVSASLKKATKRETEKFWKNQNFFLTFKLLL